MDNWVVTVEPEEEPVTLAEARAHLVMDADLTDDNDYITEAIVGARQRVEEFLNRALVTQTIALYLDRWPYNPKADGHASQVELPHAAPLQSVSSISYVDTDGNTQTFSSANYVVDTAAHPGRVYPAYGEVWPTVRNQPKAITITYAAGYGVPSVNEDAIPKHIKRAIYLTVAEWYENREQTVKGTIVAELPDGVKRILSSLRIRNIG